METLIVGLVIGVIAGIFAWKWLERKLGEYKLRREEESAQNIAAQQAEKARRSDALHAGEGARYSWNGRQIKITQNGETHALNQSVTEHARRLAIAGNRDEAVIYLNRTLRLDFDDARIVADLLVKAFP